MRIVSEPCDQCDAPAGAPCRLRCPRRIDDVEEERQYRDSATGQVEVIAGVVAGVVVFAVVLTLALMLGSAMRGALLSGFAAAAAVGAGVSNLVRQMADKRREADARRALARKNPLRP